jgi:dihydroorotate dehydrogenase (fumarate)
MTDLSVTYMGLHLDNPIVAASSGLTKNVRNVRRCAEAGAGAVVLKSLFEEEIEAGIQKLEKEGTGHSEARDYIRSLETAHGLDAYCSLIKDAKKEVSIPVIASINAVNSHWWVEHVARLEKAGADAVELNISVLPFTYHETHDTIIKYYVETVKAVRKLVSVPVAVKIGHYFTSIPEVADKLRWAGADGIVMFNRFYQPDIDIDTEKLSAASPLSTPEDIAIPLRWAMLLSGETELDIAASSGIHDGDGVVKLLLAGATVTQVATTLFTNGVEYITEMKNDLLGWMARRGYSRISEFHGRLSRKNSDRPQAYERHQYVQALVGYE